MNLTKKQQAEIECLGYFSRDNIDYSKGENHESAILQKKDGSMIEVIEDVEGFTPEEAFFEISDKGATDVKTTDRAQLLKLLDAKKWRLRMMDSYEQGLLEGATPYYTLIGLEDDKPVPEVVMEFMAKTMFAGKDLWLITKLYCSELLEAEIKKTIDAFVDKYKTMSSFSESERKQLLKRVFENITQC